MYLSEHLSEVLGGGVVAALLEVGLDLVLDLGLVQVPRVLLLGVLARRGVGSSGNLKQTNAKLEHRGELTLTRT